MQFRQSSEPDSRQPQPSQPVASAGNSRRLGWGRTALFSLLPLVVLWSFAEIREFNHLFPKFKYRRPHLRLLQQPHPYRIYSLVPRRTNAAGDVSINSLGLRGRETTVAKPANTIRVVCLGGSTTYSLGASSDSLTYPAYLEHFLRDHYRKAPFSIEVINAGHEVYASLECLILFQTFILDFSPDVAILHTGINDMWVALTFPDFRSDYSHCRRSFGPLKPHRWEYSPLLTKLLAKITTVGNPYRPNRDLTIVHLAHVPWLSEEVSLDPPTLKHRQRQVTDTVERNVRSFVAIARGNNVVPVLSTEPWGPTSDPRGKTAEVVAERIRATAVSQQVVLVDIAREMPWNPRVYYDACHLRPVPDGLERMGKIMANSLISAGVIEQARRHSGM